MRVPIRIRLAAAYCAAFFVLIAAIEAGAYFSVRAAIHSIVDHELETRLAGIDDHIARHLGKLTWPQLGQALKEHPAFQPDFLRVSNARGELLFEGRSLYGVGRLEYAHWPVLQTVSGSGRTLRALTMRRTILGLDYDLELATDLLMPAAVLGRLWLLMVVSMPVVLLIASGAGYWISGRALAPVADIIAASRSIDSTRLDQRIAVPRTGDEIQNLAETMNGMLARIEDGFRQVRNFTANASHELRTPLAIIRTTAEVALLGRAPNERACRDALRRILREAEKNSSLLEDLLELARADAGVNRHQQRPLDLRRSLTEGCSEAAPLAESRDIRLEIHAEEQCWVLGDEAQLRRLWLILLDNAVKYTLPGGAISVSARKTEGGRLCCAVSDTGIGIAAEHLPRIFERFYRADAARGRAQGGAGLGLSLARQIAALHGAALHVESTPGAGSCFRVEFPEAPQLISADILPGTRLQSVS